MSEKGYNHIYHIIKYSCDS